MASIQPLTLPEYPWEKLAPYRALAAQHPDGVCDLSIGAPVDPVPQVIQQALADHANWPGYPGAAGTTALREAIAAWYARRRNVPGLTEAHVTPTIGSKEFIAWLPLLLGIGPGDVIVRPAIAYPTYDIGAQLVGAESVAADDLDALDAGTRARVKLVWANSPGNPTGAVLSTEALATLVRQARELGAVVANDECYAELGWCDWATRGVPSILDPEVSGGDMTGLLSVYSLSKQSNMAGYRAAFAAGDPDLIQPLINTRKHAGMVVPGPVQAAMIAALSEDSHVQAQYDVYLARRQKLIAAIEQTDLEIHDSEAGLYLWVRDGAQNTPHPTEQDSWDLLERFATQGIVTGSGSFYSEAGYGFVRLSITATDDVISRAADRIAQV